MFKAKIELVAQLDIPARARELPGDDTGGRGHKLSDIVLLEYPKLTTDLLRPHGCSWCPFRVYT